MSLAPTQPLTEVSTVVSPGGGGLRRTVLITFPPRSSGSLISCSHKGLSSSVYGQLYLYIKRFNYRNAPKFVLEYFVEIYENFIPTTALIFSAKKKINTILRFDGKLQAQKA